MLTLNKDGSIHYIDTDDTVVLMNNDDIKNMLFHSFILDPDYSFISFFNMLDKYPFFLNLFSQASPYLEEFKSLNCDKDDMHESKIAVITPTVSVATNELFMNYRMEVYFKVDPSGITDDDISIMYMKDYVHFIIGMNILATVFSQADEDDDEEEGNIAVNCSFLDFDPTAHVSLIDFIKIILDNISLHGVPSERNKIIHDLEESFIEDELYLKDQADNIAADILNKIKGGN